MRCCVEGTIMLPFGIGFTFAVGFALMVGSVYGVDSLLRDPWVLMVLWGLLVGSALMTCANRAPRGGPRHHHPALIDGPDQDRVRR
jgi:hypothetical protein